MSFLKCNPSVFVVKKNYMIVVITNDNGICSLKIGNKDVFEDNSGVLFSNKNYYKFIVPQKLLDEFQEYKVCFRKTVNRKSYCSEFENEVYESFKFSSIKGKKQLNVYHFADVHGDFIRAINCCKDLCDIDLFIINGDINEYNTFEDFYDTFKFFSIVASGVPIVFSRGNHDIRGKLVENFNDFFPSVNNKNFYTFDTGVLSGVILDCGEDKVDSHKDYNGTNRFSEYRNKETDFLRKVRLDKNKIIFAVSHINPAQTTEKGISAFVIEQEKYAKWMKYLENLGVEFMVCGHIHDNYLLKANDKKSLINHAFPILVGSYNSGDILGGTLLKISKGNKSFKFTYSNGSASLWYDLSDTK